MTRLSTKLHSVALSLMLVAATGLALAQSGGSTNLNTPVKAEKKMRKHHSCGIMDQLNLTDEQRAKLKTQQQEFRQENASLISDMKAKFQELRELPKTPENQAKRDAIRAELKKNREVLHTQHMAMMQQVLNSDQMQKYQTLKQQCKAEWRNKKAAPAAAQ